MMSAQRNGGANATPQREEKRTESTAQREELQYKSIVTLQLLPQTKKHSTDGDTPISMYPFRWPSYQFQYTYSSSHKTNLFSLQLKIKYL